MFIPYSIRAILSKKILSKVGGLHKIYVEGDWRCRGVAYRMRWGSNLLHIMAEKKYNNVEGRLVGNSDVFDSHIQ